MQGKSALDDTQRELAQRVSESEVLLKVWPERIYWLEETVDRLGRAHPTLSRFDRSRLEAFGIRCLKPKVPWI